jgi:voltage-gated potassium channel
VVERVFYPADRIPFVEWSALSGAKPAVVLTGAVALLAFVTGLSNLSQPMTTLSGPLTAVVDVPPTAVQFGGVLFAFVLSGVTVGLQRRKRIAWQVAVVLLPAVLVLPMATAQATDVPIVLLTLLTFPMLLRNRSRFDQTIDLSALQIASLSAILAVLLYGTVGSYGLRSQFLELDTWSDAVYYVLVTVATVGYGDITPVTAEARWFSLSIIVFGTGAFTVAVGALIGPAIESRMTKAFGVMTASDLTLLEDHIVILGHGDLTESLLDELTDETELVVVSPDQSAMARLDDEDINLLTGDPSDESVLEDAGVERARGVIVSSNDDARDVLAVIATKNVAPEVRTVAAATENKYVEKFRSVGVDAVLNPRSIGGRLLSRSILAGESPDALLEWEEEN